MTAPSIAERALQALRDGRNAEAAALYLQHLTDGRRDLVAAVNCAIALRRLGRSDEGLRVLEPYRGANLAAVPYTLGQLYSGLRRWPEAVDAYRQARAFQSTPDLELSLARALLALGQYEEGFRLFESRVDVEGFPTRRLESPGVAEWRGESLQGRSILVWMEQGLGDQIQFARFLPLLRESARVASPATARWSRCWRRSPTRSSPATGRSPPGAITTGLSRCRCLTASARPSRPFPRRLT